MGQVSAAAATAGLVPEQGSMAAECSSGLYSTSTAPALLFLLILRHTHLVIDL